jgi:hypothetical protein
MTRILASRATLVLSCFLYPYLPALGQQNPHVSALNVDDYAIYSLIVRTDFAGKEVTKIAIEDHCVMSGLLGAQMSEGERQFDAYVQEILQGVRDDTIADFEGNYKETSELENRFSLRVPYFLATEQEEGKIVSARGEGWNNFYNKYPRAQGLLCFSRVGFDRHRSQALVYFANQSNYLGGAGYLVLLAKKNGAWLIVKQNMLWIS